MLNQQTKKMMWMIWFALLSSVFIYLAVGVILRQKQGDPPNLDAAEMLYYPMVGISLALTIGLFTVFPKLFRGLPYQIHCILRWALSESIAVFGLILSILGGPADVFITMIIWSAVLYLLQRPTDADYQRYLTQRQTTT